MKRKFNSSSGQASFSIIMDEGQETRPRANQRSAQRRFEMPTFSLFPKQSPDYSDLRSPRSSMSCQHSPSNSFSSMSESMYSSTSTAASSIDSQTYPTPLRIRKSPQQVSL